MSSSDEVPQGVDPDFAALFRSEPEPVPEALQEPPAEVPLEASAEAPAEAPEPPAAPAAPAAMTDTGRLFRSQGVKGNDAAVLALSSDHFGRLRTLKRTDAEEPVHVPLPPLAGAAAVAASVAATEPPATAAQEPAAKGRGRRRRTNAAPATDGMSARMCYLIIIGVTLVVAFINAFLANGDIGWPTGIAMLIATVFCALKVRVEDGLVPVITPALAFFLASITAAQLFLGSAERSLINRAVVVFFTLADNWVWIIGATVIALVIMIVRRRRSS